MVNQKTNHLSFPGYFAFNREDFGTDPDSRIEFQHSGPVPALAAPSTLSDSPAISYLDGIRTNTSECLATILTG